jgi:hypothetical protein
MKTTTLLLAMLFVLFIGTFATAQVQKSLIKSFNLSGANVVVLDLKGQVELKTADNSALRLQTDIDLKNGNTNLFQIFLTKKRYDVQTNLKNNEFLLTAPDRDLVRLGATELQETVTYIVYLPEGVTAKVRKGEGLQTQITLQNQNTIVMK